MHGPAHTDHGLSQRVAALPRAQPPAVAKRPTAAQPAQEISRWQVTAAAAAPESRHHAAARLALSGPRSSGETTGMAAGSSAAWRAHRDWRSALHVCSQSNWVRTHPEPQLVCRCL